MSKVKSSSTPIPTPARIADAGHAARAKPPTPQAPSSLRRGASGDEVRAVQEQLAAAGYRVTADGIYGSKTEDAVKRFQRNQGLSSDGVVGPLTREQLASAKPLSGAAREVAELPANTRLASGSAGEGVRRLQRALNERGAKLAVDGRFGPQTEAEVRKHQRRAGLAEDGIAGPLTLGSLAGAASTATASPASTRRAPASAAHAADSRRAHAQQGHPQAPRTSTPARAAGASAPTVTPSAGTSGPAKHDPTTGPQAKAQVKDASAPPKNLETTFHTPVGDLPYTQSSVGLARRAGYHGKDAAKAVFREIHVENPDGSIETRRLLPFRNAQNVWADEKGSELYLSKPKQQKDAQGNLQQVYRIENEQPNAAADAKVQATRLPPGSMVVPSLGMDARDRIADLEAKGFEVTGVLGTGFIDINGKKIVGYHYANEARLRGEAAPASAGQRVDGLGSGKIHAGYRVTRDGKMQLLDFAGQSRQQIRQELKKLEEDPNTAAINLFAHTAAQKPEDLVGVIGADKKPTALGKSRSAMVFDDKGEFVGHIQTPAVSLLDSVTLAKEVYGDKASKVLNQDGDFYAQSWFADGRPGSSDRALHYDNAMLVVKKRSPGQTSPSANGGPLNQLGRAATNAQYWVAENIVDNLNDAAQVGQQKWNELGDWLKNQMGQ